MFTHMQSADSCPTLSTPWAEKVDRDRPLPEYPRPSLVRDEWRCLNGRWQYALRPHGAIPSSYDGEIAVPFPIESALSGVRRALRPNEALWYRRAFVVPAAWRDGRVLLHIGAADWESRVSLNGQVIGSHRGGYVPFSFDITDDLGWSGEENLVVEIRDPTEAGAQCRGKQTLRPRGILYTSASGIWGAVWIEPVPISRIARVIASVPPGGRARDGRLVVEASLHAARSEPRRLHAVLKDGDRAVAEAMADIGASDEASAMLEFHVEAPKLWSPESPFLYGLSLDLDGVDRAESYAAFRTVTLGPGHDGRPRILLNGEPYFNNGILDQGYWPDGVYTAPTDEALVSDIEQAKALGFNMIRKHAKVESERWYWHCDRLGMLVWQDIPSGGEPMRLLYSAALGFAGFRLRDDRALWRFGRGDAASRADFERESSEIYHYLEGFPCIVAWVPFNEGWGQFESARLTTTLVGRDPGRLVDAASGWYDQGVGHFASRHDYRSPPRMPRADGRRARALSEYGGIALRVAGHATEDRRQFGYAGARDGDDLAARYEALASRLSRFAKEGLAASVYTQLSDVEIERNGLLTYDRRAVKAAKARVRAANLALTASGSGGDGSQTLGDGDRGSADHTSA
jgi:hypothetical protein